MDKPEVLAVLDWELSTLGDPISDLAYCCMMYHLPADKAHLRGQPLKNLSAHKIFCFFFCCLGVFGVDPKVHGIPSEAEFVSTYCQLTGTADISKHWNFYLAFTFFRVAAILQGVYKRSQQGNGCRAELS